MKHLQFMEEVEQYLASKEALDRLVAEQVVEGPVIDFKGPIPDGGYPYRGQTDELRKDATAFANSDGGWLLIGVRETDQAATAVPGVSKPLEALAKYETWLRDSVLPEIEFHARVVSLGPDLGVVAIAIAPGGDPPHAVTHVENGGHAYRHYLRDGARSRPMSELERRELMAFDRRARQVQQLFRATMAEKRPGPPFIIRPVWKIGIHVDPAGPRDVSPLPGFAEFTNMHILEVRRDATSFVGPDGEGLRMQFWISHALVDAVCPGPEDGWLVILRVPLLCRPGREGGPGEVAHFPPPR
jgi:hypothetical protein